VASVHFLCSKCDWRLVSEAGAPAPRPCENCGQPNDVIAPASGATIARCAACGDAEMYIQKDFNRTTGVVLVAIGAVFVPWTYGLSLLAVTVLDFVVYYLVRDVEVCYECQAVHRGYPLNPLHKHFDLATHDRHIYGSAPPGAEEAHR
jgi:hypothetical protein